MARGDFVESIFGEVYTKHNQPFLVFIHTKK